MVAQVWLKGSPERVATDQAYIETMDILLIVAVCTAAPFPPQLANEKLQTHRSEV